MNNRELLFSIIVQGELPDPPSNDNLEAEGVIAVLANSAENSPELLLNVIEEVTQVKISSMVAISMAILFAHAPESFFTPHNMTTCLSIMDVHTPEVLLDFVISLKENELKRGFGSRPQKMIRAVMEGWRIKTLAMYCQNFPSQMIHLLKVVHPRIPENKAEPVRYLLASFRENQYN